MSDKKWATKISGEVDGETVIRGYKLTELISKLNFTQALFLTLKGELPTETEEKMVNAILVASVDHGIGAPSTTAARISASVGNPLHVALAAGLLSTGKHHGGAVKKAAASLNRYSVPWLGQRCRAARTPLVRKTSLSSTIESIDLPPFGCILA